MRAACLLLILASARSRDSLETILARIDPPTFPPRDFYVHHYGAVPDGSTDALEGFRLAIAAARDAGGGRVVAKGGTFLLKGGLDLYDNVQLYVAKRTTLRWAADRTGFLPAVLTKFEGTELFNYHPLIRAFEAENVSVVGADPANSVLDGGGDGWPLKAPKDAKKLRELGASNAPVDASVLRPKTILRDVDREHDGTSSPTRFLGRGAPVRRQGAAAELRPALPMSTGVAREL